MSTFTDLVRIPKVSWDAEAKAVYVYLQELPTGSEFLLTQRVSTDGLVIVDASLTDPTDIYGVELLAFPEGDDRLELPASLWVIAGMAWERCRALMASGARSGVFAL